MARRRRTRGLGEVVKKDFVAIAGILRSHCASDAVVSDLATYFRRQNPRFDTSRFVKAAVCRRG